jgi:hypothetical protein
MSTEKSDQLGVNTDFKIGAYLIFFSGIYFGRPPDAGSSLAINCPRRVFRAQSRAACEADLNGLHTRHVRFHTLLIHDVDVVGVHALLERCQESLWYLALPRCARRRRRVTTNACDRESLLLASFPVPKTCFSIWIIGR